ncbi:hypothetical protein PB2503_03042 [Parvularcula bermudensis HTCC2503]|uniref:PD-(D/E)XK endonuclease-like domain-containing protein n=1 Tax=Parvularcula bermudensis (strain ATCC BAA-594 / HTCC2503 / KCTC 12087) TaxID=314260 RepID=E0TD26_PARBH|nr:double-strand break repair protein AddB [Parvularcula bermudensis]ADM08685.1 hypothetical protein PB2503_03042 [Parvularcula bermudensis HTCC2503]
MTAKSDTWLTHRLRADPAIFTIPQGVPFLEALVAPLMRAFEGDPAGLADLTIYLPNRRAARRLIDHLAASAPTGTVILPQLRVLGDITEDDLMFSAPDMVADEEVPLAVDPMDRRLILAHLLAQRKAAEGDTAAPARMSAAASPDWPSLLAGADALASVLDSFHREALPLSALLSMTPEDLAGRAADHWHEHLRFLSILAEAWPAILSKQGCIELSDRQTRLMTALADHLSATPDGPPILIAGALGATEATAHLMESVAKSPRGAVILPGAMPMAADQSTLLPPSHPQAAFQRWLRRVGGGASVDLSPWDERMTDRKQATRAFLSLALTPAEETGDWHRRFADFRDAYSLDEALAPLSFATAGTPNEEADFVALLLREVLETEGKTALLVTPDRDLARRVCAKLRQWDIRLDDSGGTPLYGAYRGTYIRQWAHWLGAPDDPVALAALVAHGLFLRGLTRSDKERLARRVDRRLRGMRPRDWQDTQRRLAGEGPSPLETELLQDLDAALRAFQAATTQHERLRALIEIADRFARSADGDQLLWQDQDGEALAAQLSAMMQTAFLPDCPPAAFASLFEALLGSAVIRTYGTHPRLTVLGLVEARLQSADRVILAGLTEGTWPKLTTADPFLPHNVRLALGLPTHDAEVGRSALDFVDHALGEEVILIRSEKSDRGPALPSRWLTRLYNLIEAAKQTEATDITGRLRGWVGALRHPASVDPALPPMPRPAAALLPARLSVSDIGQLIRDPYSVYARRLLRLFPLDPLAQEPAERERGTLFHAVYERLAKVAPDRVTQEVFAHALAETIDDCLYPSECHDLYAMMGQRAGKAFSVISQTQRRDGATATFAEIEGELTVMAGGRSIDLYGRADRIDLYPDGTYTIIDYKGGSAPTFKQDASFEPQLSVLAMMAAAGGFKDLRRGQVRRLAYTPMLRKEAWSVPFTEEKVPWMVAGEDLKAHLLETAQNLNRMMTEFVSGQFVFHSQLRPFKSNSEGDYDHLARRREWAGMDGSADGGGEA